MNNKDYIESKIIFRKVDNYYFKLDDYTKSIFNKLLIMQLGIINTDKILFMDFENIDIYLDNPTEYEYLNNLTEYEYIIIYYERCKRSLPNETKCREIHEYVFVLINDCLKRIR